MICGPWIIPLDASDPALDHHRPGGLGLFGTAMGVETIAAAARAVLPAVLVLENVLIEEPCILPDHTTHALELSISPDRQARLVTPAGNGPEVLHFSAHVTSQAHAPAAAVTTGNPEGGINAGEVYRLFFHGPAFQVIARAAYAGGVLTAEASDGPKLLPPWARLMEFGLQTAGLCELAETGRMMIPRAIGRVEYGAHPTSLPALAQARRGTGGAGFDIELFDRGDNFLMRIEDYRTTALPFASSALAARDLMRRLLHTP